MDRSAFCAQRGDFVLSLPWQSTLRPGCTFIRWIRACPIILREMRLSHAPSRTSDRRGYDTRSMISFPRLPLSLHEEVPPDPQPPTLTNDVPDRGGEAPYFSTTITARTPFTYEQPYPRRRDPQSLPIPRNLERETVDPEEIPCRIRPEPLLLHFSIASAVPVPTSAPGSTSAG